MKNVKDACPSGRSELDRGRESPDQQILDEGANLLTVRDAGELSVLAADKHAGVEHDDRNAASLTFRETERHENLNAIADYVLRRQYLRR